MIRALMASPKAKGLFVRAILQSDPQSYPLENRTISQSVVGEYALSQMGCTTLSCAQGLSLSVSVAATSLVAEVAPDLSPADQLHLSRQPFTEHGWLVTGQRQ
jgi:carboxylesterase type B